MVVADAVELYKVGDDDSLRELFKVLLICIDGVVDALFMLPSDILLDIFC